MNFRNIIFVLVIVVFVLQLLVMKEDSQIQTPSKKPLIALSTFSLYDITKHIAEDTMDVFMILPFGVDAHSFEPTPKLMTNIYKSDLVVYSGAGLEPWIDGFEFKNSVIDMSRHVKLMKIDSQEEHEQHHHHEHEEHHHHEHEHHAHNGIDPHYWLDINNMAIATKLITKKLIEISPDNKSFYEKNRDSYLKMLSLLDAEYKKRLLTCEKDTIVVNHNAFSYLSNSYGFKVESLSGFSPEAEPSAKNMAKLIEHVKEDNISTLFYESFVSDRAIKSIANEAHVKVDVLQPLGNITADEAAKKLSYEDIMRVNLEKISKALECR